MQARWIQLPFDPVRGTFDDTPLVRALEERPATAVREYLFHFDERPHLGCFVQWRPQTGHNGKRRPTEAELDELIEELEAEGDSCPACGLGVFGGLNAIEVRRVSPAELVRIEREGRARRERGSTPPHVRATADEDATETTRAARNGRSASNRKRSAEVAEAPTSTPIEDEPLDGPALRAAEALRVWRNTRRRELDVPAYRVLTNRQLEAIARRRPDTLGALAEIAGLGPATLATHGEAILACLKSAELRARDAEDVDSGDDSLAEHAERELTVATATPDASPAQSAAPVGPDVPAASS